MRRFPLFSTASIWFLAAVALVTRPDAALAQREAPAALIAAARAVAGEMAGIRELVWLGSVNFQVSDRGTIQRYARAALDREMPSDQWSAQEALLLHCGLLPAGVDLQDLIVRLYTEQVAGYYDPHRKTFYLADWLPRLLQRAVVAHEVTHALQDQHFDLVRWLENLPPAEDETLARAAVVEGDAMAAMLAYLLAPMGGSVAELPDVAALLEGSSAEIARSYPTFDSAPEALQRLLLFPYVEGSGFVLAALREGGWDAVDRLYRDPPRSTEQILHPERYWSARDDPRQPERPGGQDAGPLLTEGSWGEFGAALVLGASLGDSVAAVAARGWDGDRYALFGRPAGGPAYAWTLLWDSPVAAKRFAEAYAQATASRFPGSARVVTGQGRFLFENAARTLELTWDTDRVEIRENFGRAPGHGTATPAKRTGPETVVGKIP